MTGPQVHDPAPDVALLDLAARQATLSAYWRRGPAVVVFLRYFGCPFCQAQVAHLRDERERFDQAGAGIVLIGQGQPSDASAFTERLRQPFECLVDPDRSAYRRAIELSPDPIYRVLAATLLPLVYESADDVRAWRDRLSREVDELLRSADVDLVAIVIAVERGLGGAVHDDVDGAGYLSEIGRGQSESR